MSAGRHGHSAQDAQTTAVPGGAGPAQERFLRAAVAHAEQQLSVQEDHAERVAVKAEEMAVQWRLKAANAEQLRLTAQIELEMWKAKLSALLEGTN